MGLKKKFQRIFKRQGNEHVTEFNKDSIQKKFEDFINTTSNLEDKAISLKKKYVSHYFHSESYETPLYFTSLQVPQRYRSGEKIQDVKALSYFKARLTDFIKAFEVTLDNDFERNIARQRTEMENFRLLLQTLMKLVPDSIVKVAQDFDKEEIEETTKNYVDRLQEEEMGFVCPGLTKAECEKRLMGFAIVAQFCLFLYLLRVCLQDLLPLLPH